MRVSPIYSATLEELRSGRRRLVHQGGQWSGKTVNILAALATLSAQEVPDGTGDNGITTVTGKSLPHLKSGALRDFESFVYPEFKSSIVAYHKTDRIFTFSSGSKIEFKSFESEYDARGAKRKRLFVNEANSVDWAIFFQADSRSQQTVLDYNPSARFWCHENVIGREGTRLLISDHRHNPFLSEGKHREIESYYDFKTGEGDYELWKVYARGLTGNVKGVIFPNWEMVDINEFPVGVDWVYGVDFGYTNDPTAVVKVYKLGRTLYVQELAYKTGMAESEIFRVLLDSGYRTTDPVFCEHDPDMIRLMRNAGIKSAMPARKGAGSVNAGIELLRKLNVRYSSDSRNLHRERGLYVWLKDKSTGDVTNIPIDKNNHLMDAIRYAAYTRYLKTGSS